ncbi:MAG: hypothetical protein KAS93_00220 [Gammaproteobacteria bacterium]|nr:hypothetical protein [Gammaproteobacteria bacterium]
MALTTYATSAGVAVLSGADNDTDHATYLQSAIEGLRALIGKVPGSGQIRGINIYNGVVYAFRDNTAVTACVMWKATSIGWVEIDLNNIVHFTLGTAELSDGEVLTQSGTTATILRVVKQSGDWGANDAAGYFIIDTVSNPSYANAVATSALGSCTLDGAEQVNTIPAGGTYEFVNHNFFGSIATKRMYACNGVSPMFEFDGTIYVPLSTGNAADKPSHIAVYKFHLFFSIDASLQNSATGDPYVYAGSGANEIGVGDDIVGIREEIGNSLAILSRNKTRMLYGSDSTDFDLRTLSEEAGGIEWTMQRIGAMRYMDDRGFTSLNAVQAYGDFKDNVFSQLIEPLVDASKTKVTTSSISKTKNQYRVFLNDASAIYATFDNKKIKGFTTVDFTDGNGDALIVRCAANGEDTNGNEIAFFGSDDGYVYQMDKGTSFDGYKVESFIRLSFSHMDSPEDIKRFLKAVLEVSADSQVTLLFTADFDYSEREDITHSLEVSSGGGYWNIDNWNEFNWSEASISNPEAYLDGSGKNIGILIYSEATYEEPHTIHSAILHYEQRRRSR